MFQETIYDAYLKFCLLLTFVTQYVYKSCFCFSDPLELAKNVAQYTALFFEYYCLIFHDPIVRLWIFLNIGVLLTHAYTNIREPDKDSLQIGQNEIRKFGIGVMIFGTILLFFVNVPTIILLLYLIYRNFTALK